MKIADGFMLRQIADSYVVVPTGDNLVDFSSMITTNETGSFIWKCLEKGMNGEDITKALLSEYEGVGADEAKNDVDEFISSLKENNILE